ncbi:hypothetical protein JQN58_21385 [Aneurinibacillus sp. BA2021]|nr:hypothetical protein [Aneurinibacillus sp. BA2021]
MDRLQEIKDNAVHEKQHDFFTTVPYEDFLWLTETIEQYQNEYNHLRESFKFQTNHAVKGWEKVIELEKQLKQANEPRPIEEWGEDYGDCLWWSFPIEEPPYCGSPLDCNFPDYVTHFTRLILPVEQK